MYVSYLLEKDGPMYPGPVRHSGGLNLAAQNFVGAPQYADYGGYHVNLDGAQSPGPAWPAPYAAPLRDDWAAYGQGAPPAVHGGLNGGSPGAPVAYSPAEYHPHHHPHHLGPPPAGPAPHCPPGALQPLSAAAPEPLSPGGQRRGLCEWMRKPAQPPLSSQGKCGPARQSLCSRELPGAARPRVCPREKGGKRRDGALPVGSTAGAPVRPGGAGNGQQPGETLALLPPLRSPAYSHLEDFYNQL